MHKFIFITILVFLLSSCNSVDNGTLKTIKNLRQETDSLINVVDNLPKDSLRLMYQTAKEKLDFFRKLNTLLSNKEHQNIVSEWSYSFKFLKNQKSKPSNFFYQLNTTKRQLDNLKEDIENNAWSDKEISQFVGDEQQALEKTKLEIKEFSIAIEKGQKKFNQLYPKINTIIDSVKQTTNELK